MNENAQKIVNAVIATSPADRIPTEEEVKALVMGFRVMFTVTDEDVLGIIRYLHSKLPISMDMGTVIKEDNYQSWLPGRKPDIIPFYWDRYSKFLIRDEHWNKPVITTLDRVTDEILDLLVNPKDMDPLRRRGLVMGDVQSGKTATYTALCCKAADAGYRMIILLTGTIENLRRQTQKRLDAGFVGLNSSDKLTQKQSKAVGVGTIDFSRTAGVFTSQKADFSSNLLNQLGFRLNAFKEPVLVIVKKNKKILENLETWLRAYNADGTGKIDMPMLLIDDEADNASVNTNVEGSDPTAINERIRALLHLFTRTSYVGFTATPFANIFINPDSIEEMVGDDLFPKDFIYALEAPTNYIGANAVFNEGAPFENIVHSIDDADRCFPPSHKSDHTVTEIPDSLKEAINIFVLANVIRDLRGDDKVHRSMLVNVSRFTKVQDQVAQKIDEYLRVVQQDIRNYSQLNVEEACLNSTISNLRNVWSKEYDESIEFSWENIQHSLVKAALPIVVRSVNQRTGAASLDYDAYKQDGLRVIAVGGNSLSRGLTLEGLCISYFYRNSQMYDTLMQMGRWFGYRDGYVDICRIWMADEAVHWYSHIALATNELRNEIRRMRRLNYTPSQFGLKVRAHPESLIITARNKMRSAHTIERMISISGELLETPRLFLENDINSANLQVADRFINTLKTMGLTKVESPWKNAIWYRVPKKHIVNFLNEFKSHPLNTRFQAEDIASFLERTSEPKLDFWDIVIPNGQGKPDSESITGVLIQRQERVLGITSKPKTILVSGKSARVGSRGITKEGLSKEDAQRIEAEFKENNPGKSLSDEVYLKGSPARSPLMLIHLIDGYTKDKSTGEKKLLETGGKPLVAIGMGFPYFDAGDQDKFVTYKVNLVEWRNWFADEEDDDVEVEYEFVQQTVG